MVSAVGAPGVRRRLAGCACSSVAVVALPSALAPCQKKPQLISAPRTWRFGEGWVKGEGWREVPFSASGNKLERLRQLHALSVD